MNSAPSAISALKGLNHKMSARLSPPLSGNGLITVPSPCGNYATLTCCHTGPRWLPLGNNRHECGHGELERDGNSADAGSWSEDNATAEGPDRLIATTKD